MSEPGIPLKTATLSKNRRLEQLFGPGYVLFMYYELGLYMVSARKDGQYANWTMIEEDFGYTDDELIEKFINPAKGVFKNV